MEILKSDLARLGLFLSLDAWLPKKTFPYPFKRYEIGRLSADADCQMADTDYRQTGRQSANTDYWPIIGAPLIKTWSERFSNKNMSYQASLRNNRLDNGTIIRLYHMQRAAYCYSYSVVCLSVGHNSEHYKNGWTDWDALWVVDLDGPEEPWTSW